MIWAPGRVVRGNAMDPAAHRARRVFYARLRAIARTTASAAAEVLAGSSTTKMTLPLMPIP